MLSNLLNKIADAPRQSAMFGTFAVLIGGLLVSMYSVCNAQVRSAEALHATAKVQRLAVLDCMASDRRASYAGCVNQVASTFQGQPAPMSALLTVDGAQPAQATYAAVARGQMMALMPVNYYTRGIH